MAMNLRGGGAVRAEMNVTPMIDILLVLLVVFILIQPLKKHGYRAEVPEDNKTSGTDPERTVVLELLDRSGEEFLVRINRKEVPWRDLKEVLADIYKMRAEKVIFLQADDDMEFRKVAAVLDAIREADLQIRVGLMGARSATAD
jgi:biopolymer transport protein ExbD